MRKVASECRALGYIHEAEQLEAKALEVERAQAAANQKPPPASSAPRPPMPKPPSSTSSPKPPPAKPPTSSGPVTDARQLLAAELVRAFAKGQAPKDVIKRFQLQEGLTADGIYGPKTAAALIKYGYVPPTPVSWPKQGTEAAKTAYIALLAAKSNDDPVRAEEWRKAMGKIRAGAGPGPPE